MNRRIFLRVVSVFPMLSLVPKAQASLPRRHDKMDECNGPDFRWHQEDIADFERVWCANCENPECVRSSASLPPRLVPGASYARGTKLWIRFNLPETCECNFIAFVRETHADDLVLSGEYEPARHQEQCLWAGHELQWPWLLLPLKQGSDVYGYVVTIPEDVDPGSYRIVWRYSTPMRSGYLYHAQRFTLV